MMIKTTVFCFILFFCKFALYESWIFSSPQSKFIDYSNKISVNLTGFMTAFGDFDADRMVDIFVLDKTDNVQHVDVILMTKQNQVKLTLFNDTDKTIRNINVGDFNGDSILDVVTYSSKSKDGPFSLEIAYGNQDRKTVNARVPVSDINFLSQPLHMDWNADMIGDFFGIRNTTSGTKQFVVLLGLNNKTFTEQSLDYLDATEFQTLLFSFFIDLNQDGQSDILLIGQLSEGDLILVSLMKDNLKFVHHKSKIVSIYKSIEVTLIGQPSIADFGFNGSQQMIIPVCVNQSCVNSQILLCSLVDLNCVQSNFSQPSLGFQSQSVANIDRLSLTVPQIAPFSCGDVQMNGRIGCVVPAVRLASKPYQMTVARLQNDGDGRFSLVELDSDPALLVNATQVALFDLIENGILDVIIAGPRGESGKIIPLLQDPTEDPYFLKVMVLNGLCNSPDHCSGKLPFGIPLPGIVVNYSTESVNGQPQSSMVSMVSTSTHTSLMLPYVVFGLSTFSNYIEKLVIQLPFNAPKVRQHTLTFIVPKTQIVIIPYPLDDPEKWKIKLYLEPFADRKVIYVAAALLGTMFIVAIILFIFQYLEIREDRLEKMQEAQKFNFDAM